MVIDDIVKRTSKYKMRISHTQTSRPFSKLFHQPRILIKQSPILFHHPYSLIHTHRHKYPPKISWYLPLIPKPQHPNSHSIGWPPKYQHSLFQPDSLSLPNLHIYKLLLARPPSGSNLPHQGTEPIFLDDIGGALGGMKTVKRKEV